jgi:hypothetical protein
MLRLLPIKLVYNVQVCLTFYPEEINPVWIFVLKILEVFPEIDLYWILIGKGNLLKSNNEKGNLSTENVISPISDENIVSENLLLKINNSGETEEKIQSQKKYRF